MRFLLQFDHVALAWIHSQFDIPPLGRDRQWLRLCGSILSYLLSFILSPTVPALKLRQHGLPLGIRNELALYSLSTPPCSSTGATPSATTSREWWDNFPWSQVASCVPDISFCRPVSSHVLSGQSPSPAGLAQGPSPETLKSSRLLAMR